MANKKNQKKKGQKKQARPKEQPAPEAVVREEEDMVVLEYPDGTTVSCFVEGRFDCDDREYMAVVPDDGSGDVYVYRFIQDSETEYHLKMENNEKKFEAAVREYERLIGYTGEEN